MERDVDWSKAHVLRVSSDLLNENSAPDADRARRAAEPWLSALLQAEHANLLLGSGFTTAVAHTCGAAALGMRPATWNTPFTDALTAAGKRAAEHVGRKQPNIEDEIRVARQLLDGLRVLELGPDVSQDDGFQIKAAGKGRALLQQELNRVLDDFMGDLLKTEREILAALTRHDARATSALRLLGSFLLTFSSRAASRERLSVFTTNYDRLIEYGADLLGLRLVDRFVGTLSPVFRSSRLGIDLHYNPPGIRGEPRYLCHGSA